MATAVRKGDGWDVQRRTSGKSQPVTLTPIASAEEVELLMLEVVREAIRRAK